jgi:hypothetical protein
VQTGGVAQQADYSRDPRIIVPDETSTQGGEIGQEDKENDQGALPDWQRSSTNGHSLGEGLL